MPVFTNCLSLRCSELKSSPYLLPHSWALHTGFSTLWMVNMCLFGHQRRKGGGGWWSQPQSTSESPCVSTPSLCPFPRFCLLLPTPCSLLFQPCYIPVHIPVWEKWSSRWIQSYFTLKYKQLNRTHVCPSCNGLQSYCEKYALGTLGNSHTAWGHGNT